MSEGFVLIDKYLKMFFIYLLFVTLIHEEADLKLVIRCFLIVMAVYMLHSVWEFRQGRFVFRMGITRLIGIDSTLGDPNAFAGTLVYALCLVPASWHSTDSKRWRAFLLFYMLLTAGCIGLTGSRSGFVLLCLWTTFTVLRSRLRWVLAALAVVAAPICFAMLPPSLQNRFESIIDPSVAPLNARVSAEGRIEGLMLGLKLFNELPLTGCGPGVWRPATGSPLEAHNLYGQVLGELGIVGTIPFVCVVLCFWFNARRVAKVYRRERWDRDFLYHLGQCLGTALILLLINGNFGHNLFRYTWLWYGAFLIVTRSLVERRLQEGAETQQQPEPVQEWSPSPTWRRATA
jgi:O-antigen ligase